jgi:hypothetical protein
VELPLLPPLHFGIFAALPGAAAALAVALRAFRCAAVELTLRSLVLLRTSSLRRRLLLCFRGDVGALCLAASVFPLRVLMAGVVA